MEKFQSHINALNKVIARIQFSQTMQCKQMILSEADQKKAKWALDKISDAIGILNSIT